MANMKSNRKAKNEATTLPFQPMTPSKAWTKTLTEAPVISPLFAGTLAIAATDHVHEWILKNAPPAIVSLWRGMESLRLYEQEFEAGNGRVSEDANSSIVGTVVETINALDNIGNAWIATTP